jgi:hypothetical protein
LLVFYEHLSVFFAREAFHELQAPLHNCVNPFVILFGLNPLEVLSQRVGRPALTPALIKDGLIPYSYAFIFECYYPHQRRGYKNSANPNIFANAVCFFGIARWDVKRDSVSTTRAVVITNWMEEFKGCMAPSAVP